MLNKIQRFFKINLKKVENTIKLIGPADIPDVISPNGKDDIIAKLDDKIKTLKPDADPKAVNPAEAKANPKAIKEAIDKYNLIIKNNVDAMKKSLEKSTK